MNEMLQLRQRLYQLETQQFIASFHGRVVGGPAELPVPELGEGGGVIPIPQPEIAEYPNPTLLGRLVDRLTSIETRLVEIETKLQVMEQGKASG